MCGYLGALVDGQPGFAFVPVGDDGAGFQSDAGVAAEAEAGIDHVGGAGERVVDVAGIDMALEGEIVAEGRVDHRLGWVEGGEHVDDGVERVVVDGDVLGSVFRFGAGGGDDHGHRFALPAHPAERERVLWGRFQAT